MTTLVCAQHELPVATRRFQTIDCEIRGMNGWTETNTNAGMRAQRRAETGEGGGHTLSDVAPPHQTVYTLP